MLRHSLLGTPCPSSGRDPTLTGGWDANDESTANVEFTSAFGRGLKNVKPRRNHNFAIHDDSAQKVRQHDLQRERMPPKSNTMISQPPQRPPRQQGKHLMSFAADHENHGLQSHAGPPKFSSLSRPSQLVPPPPATSEVYFTRTSQVVPSTTSTTNNNRLSQAPRRPIVSKAVDQEEEDDEQLFGGLTELPPAQASGLTGGLTSTVILKPARRGTIYIPNDDTTMPSMYMGIFSPIKEGGQSDFQADFTGIAAQMARKRGRPGPSTTAAATEVAASPERPPLQKKQNIQELAVVQDRLGQGGGKENVPPGYYELGHSSKHVKAEKPKRLSVAKGQTINRHLDGELQSEERSSGARRRTLNTSSLGGPVRPVITDTRKSKLHAETASSAGRMADKKPVSRPADKKPSWNAGFKLKTSQPVTVRTISPKPASPVVQSKEQETVCRKPPIPSRFVTPSIKSEPLVDSYPLLTEDLATPSMYEDSWLSHQEIAMTQLVNNLFAASSSSCSVDDGMLRIQLLELYAKDENATLYKRLQGAVLYGALSVFHDGLKSTTSLGTDVGKRKAFTDLWLETYDLSFLRSALEVVVGRQCRRSTATASPTTSRRSLDKENDPNRRILRKFIETLLIRNEDGNPDDSSTDRATWSYQRTLLRSMMLIKLLDAARSSSTQLVGNCLFQPSSPYKSSADVLKGLFQLLNPNAGDPVRVLGYIGYQVGHSQYPLEEYTYQMDNLAVDLRDGVRLTRLVELLLYPSASQLLEHAHDSDSTTTVILPDGALLSLTDGPRDWPLSQHLKFPCIGRAAKLYNVQIALSALRGVQGMAALTHDVREEDIVDGFREKTVKLLWGLTSKWGLSGLVDWDDVEREIKRLCRTHSCADNDFYDMSDDEEGLSRYKTLLKSWAQAVAGKRGLVVKNLTTSFADGRVFGALVDEYHEYLHTGEGSSSQRESQGPKRRLCERLRSLGCSEQFSALFSPSDASAKNQHSHVFDRDFVLAALVFLASRLLGPSKRVRSAVAIQRAWRRHWIRLVDCRKRELKIIAMKCAESAQRKHEPVFGLKGGLGQGRGNENENENQQQTTTIAEEVLSTEPNHDSNQDSGVNLHHHCDPRPSPGETEEEDIWLNL